MSRKLSATIFISLLLVAFLAINASASQTADNNVWKYREYIEKNSKTRLAGAERAIDYVAMPGGANTAPLGFDEINSASPGISVGITTHDFQHNGRTNRQVDWRGTQVVHLIWFKQTDFIAGGDGGTGYEAFDPVYGSFVFQGTGGGCDIHPRLGSGTNFSGYIALEVDTEGKAVIANHHDEGAGYASTVWYDFDAVNCFFSPYKRRLPDSLMKYGVPPDQITSGEFRFIWPDMAYHVYDGDTVTHVFAMQLENEIDESFVHYFRRVGSDTLGNWDYPSMLVDTIPCISQVVVASRNSAKVALVWMAPPGAYPGDPESWDRDWLDPGLGVNQRTNDVYMMMSYNMGASWNPKQNISAYDSTTGGYLGHSDISALIDTQDRLHILWDARVIAPPDPDVGGLGAYTYFWGSRLLHWDEFNSEIRTVKDANWNIADETINDSTCTGGAWNEMSIVKPQIAECDGKFYALFVQFLDLENGIYIDCAALRWQGAGYRGTANGELYIAVSDNGGYNWDIARNLTNTYTPLCDTSGTPYECESDHWPAISRFGMQVFETDDFDIVPIVDPSGDYAGDMYLDVLYVNDKFPGSCQQDAAIWTTNPVKWFRVPCVEPVPNPVIVIYPREITQPTWVKPGETITETITLENVGNAELHVTSISTVETNGDAGWLDVSNYGPVTISHLTPNSMQFTLYLNAGGTIQTGPAVVTGYVQIESDAANGTGYIPVELIVADTVMFPEEMDIRTVCKRLIFSNAGNIGSGGGYDGNGGYNMGFFDDCDTTNNVSGADDQANVYLYSGSPFICYIDGSDTIMNYYMFDATWLSDDGFRPIESPHADSTTYPDYQYGYSGQFLSNDSNIMLECEYFAPKHSDSCSFIVMKQRIMNISDKTFNNVFYGDAIDWDIPSDSGSENGSDFDATRKLMYCYGAEYDADSIENNDCVLADDRLGGLAFYGGFKLPHTNEVNDRYTVPRAMWTRMNADYVYPMGGFVPSQLYQLMTSITGYSVWTATNQTYEDSLYQDLHMISVFTQRTLNPGDTMVFVKILSTSNTGLMTLQMNVDKARMWIMARPDIFTWPEVVITCCCDKPGDSNNNGSVNILDVTYTISYLYKSGPPPPCPAEADANGNCSVNILDVTYTISYLYKSGPAPKCPPSDCPLCNP
ncbi:MAG: dockerin type I repeat-containing protein [Candidatus Zixiibacteriota bacterium]